MHPVQHALALLRQGKLVAIPTETVYGLAADASNPSAVQAVFTAKGRPQANPLIVHIANVQALTDWAIDIPEAAYRLAEQFWPGPLTLILKKAPQVSSLITGGQDTVALRSPRHPLTQELLQLFQGGLVAPSANRYCSISPTQAKNVQQELGASVDFILDGGPCEVGIESSILDLSTKPYTLLREGMISKQALEAALHEPIQKADEHHATKAPGQNKRHYAPKTPLQLVTPAQLETTLNRLTPTSKVVVLSYSTPDFLGPMTWLAMPNTAEAYARELYSKLRLADELHCEWIIVESVPEGPEWAGILDRLTRASTA